MYVFVNAYAPTSLLLQVKAGPRLGSVPLPNWHWCGTVGAGSPVSRKDGCSGQMPVSSTPTVTPLPALTEPPTDGQTSVAPMNFGVASVAGCWTSSCWTAATP